MSVSTFWLRVRMVLTESSDERVSLLAHAPWQFKFSTKDVSCVLVLVYYRLLLMIYCWKSLISRFLTAIEFTALILIFHVRLAIGQAELTVALSLHHFCQPIWAVLERGHILHYRLTQLVNPSLPLMLLHAQVML